MKFTDVLKVIGNSDGEVRGEAQTEINEHTSKVIDELKKRRLIIND